MIPARSPAIFLSLVLALSMVSSSVYFEIADGIIVLHSETMVRLTSSLKGQQNPFDVDGVW